MSRTLFASDVHLRPNDPPSNRSFFRFLEEDCAALYLVGDLFDYWIGPKHLRGPDYRDVFEALRRKSERAKVYFIKGNRDYLVEEKFERSTGTTVLGDRARIELGGRTVLLAHGDFVYNTNPKYAAYRTLMRSKPIEDLWLAIPGVVARRLVRGYRKVSPMTTPSMSWTPEKLLGRARPLFEAGADVLICGHIHQPQHLAETVNGRRCELFILGDWCGGTQDYVEFDGSRFRIRRWDR
jgi:UDP-2,3-diacylglucosamine hydrolase